MDISLNGYGEQVATFAVSGEVKVGMPVKISANGTVAPCVAKDKFCGVVLSLRGGYAKLPYTGTKPTVGYQTVNADGTGKVQVEATGRLLLITDVDEPSGTCGLVLA